MNNQRLSELLAGVPETRLAIFNLARKYIGTDGLNREALRQHPGEEIEQASTQAQEYARQTKNLNERLLQLALQPAGQP